MGSSGRTCPWSGSRNTGSCFLDRACVMDVNMLFTKIYAPVLV